MRVFLTVVPKLPLDDLKDYITSLSALGFKYARDFLKRNLRHHSGIIVIGNYRVLGSKIVPSHLTYVSAQEFYNSLCPLYKHRKYSDPLPYTKVFCDDSYFDRLGLPSQQVYIDNWAQILKEIKDKEILI